ncbi:MAG: ribose 5-phosphate isomerase B [Alphaproteobacteria bacterium]
MSQENKTFALGCDHHGIALKSALIEHLKTLGFAAVDVGAHDTESAADYTDYAHAVSDAIATEKAVYGILICGSGIGMSMAANRHPKIRAALCHDLESAEMTRRHNNANVLVLSGKNTSETLAKEMITLFTETAFEGGRHLRRINKF